MALLQQPPRSDPKGCDGPTSCGKHHIPERSRPTVLRLQVPEHAPQGIEPSDREGRQFRRTPTVNPFGLAGSAADQNLPELLPNDG